MRLLVLSLTLAFSVHAGEPKPNILLILVDDMGYGDPRCFNPELSCRNHFPDFGKSDKETG